MSSTEPHTDGKDGRKAAWRDPAHLAFLANNVLSLIGFLCVGVGLILLVTFALFVIVSPSVNPYFGIIGYVIVPGVFILGLIVVPLGMLLKHWRVRRSMKATPGAVLYPRIDLNDPETRRFIVVFSAFSAFVVLPIVGVSSYYGYAWTESTTFCGKLCHSVMKPQDTAHARSAHARVTCAECHIGPGASWFVKSKITGVGQVIAVAENSYPRPIPNAITNLRPARETCEQCHWPAQFFGAQYRERVNYAQDKGNTRRVVRMMVKTGGADRLTGRIEGIHMHMILYGHIEYVATDPDLQDIPWVRHTLPDGQVLTYRSDGKPSNAPPPLGVVRRVDCMDCHNRAAHDIRAPAAFVDVYMAAGKIDASLPFVKREAVAALSKEYADDEQARKGIEEALTSFYQREYLQVWTAKQADIGRVAGVVQTIYDQNFFPYMKENWRTYPDNVGHKVSAGCFRCHDGLHVNQFGQPITSNCSVCHVFLNPTKGKPQALVEGPFVHPFDLMPKHEHLRCDQCHTGAELPSCKECHESGQWLAQKGKVEVKHMGG